MKKHIGRRNVGIWIDHEKAILATMEEGSVETRTLLSEVGPRVRLSGGSRSKAPYGPQEKASDTQRDRKYRQKLTSYYRRVAGELIGAEGILILGPGEAKRELARELSATRELGSKVAAVETADKMTDRQIAARVKEFFGAGARRP